VGQLALAQLHALAADDADAVRAGGALELRDEPRLAEPGLAGDERERRALLERLAQLGQLAGPADEAGAGHAAGHDPIMKRAAAASRGAAGGGGGGWGHAM